MLLTYEITGFLIDSPSNGVPAIRYGVDSTGVAFYDSSALSSTLGTFKQGFILLKRSFGRICMGGSTYSGTNLCSL